MELHFIAGKPASGKDTTADIITRLTKARKISMSEHLLKPLVKSDSFRSEISEEIDVKLPNNLRFYNTNQRADLILLGDVLNRLLKKKSNYNHFSDLAIVHYDESLVIPSFRQEEMLQFPERAGIPHDKYWIKCSDSIRYRRWKERDEISHSRIVEEDEVENRKYWNPLKEKVDFDHVLDNSSTVSDLEKQVKVLYDQK